MTNEKAIKILKSKMDGSVDTSYEWAETVRMAINALEKQIPMKPIRIDKNKEFDGNWKKICPSCKSVLIERITTDEESYPRLYNYTPHCKCGQAIDWEGE